MSENKSNEENQVEKQTKLRSRLYPRYDLEDAIKFVQSIHKLGGNRVSNQAVAVEVGKAVNNSGFTGRVSSAKQFGLLNQEAGKLSESSLAKEILVPRSESEKAESIKRALSSPDLYKEIISDFAGKILPDQSTLANRLFHDYRIEEVAKDNAAKNFIRSAQYAGVIRNGILMVSTDDFVPPQDDQGNDDTGAMNLPPQGRNQGTPPPGVQGAIFQDNGAGWSVMVKSQKPLNSKTKQKLIEVAELLDEVNTG